MKNDQMSASEAETQVLRPVSEADPSPKSTSRESESREGASGEEVAAEGAESAEPAADHEEADESADESSETDAQESADESSDGDSEKASEDGAEEGDAEPEHKPETVEEYRELEEKKRKKRSLGLHRDGDESQTQKNFWADFKRARQERQEAKRGEGSTQRQSHHTNQEAKKASARARKIVAPVIAGVAVVLAILGLITQLRWNNDPWARPEASLTTRYSVTDTGVLPLINNAVQIKATSSNDICVALTSSTDAEGWIAGQKYTRITGTNSWTQLATQQATAPKARNTKVDEQQVPLFKDFDSWQRVSCGKRVTLNWKGDKTSADVLIIDANPNSRLTGSQSASPVTLQMSWIRTDLNSTARLLWLLAALVALLAGIVATIFALAPRLRRKPKRLVDAERMPAKMEGTEEIKVAGDDAPRWANDHVVKERKRARRHVSSHRAQSDTGLSGFFKSITRKPSSAAGSSQASGAATGPNVVDVRGANFVQRMQEQTGVIQPVSMGSASAAVLGASGAAGASGSAAHSGVGASFTAADAATTQVIKPINASVIAGADGTDMGTGMGEGFAAGSDASAPITGGTYQRPSDADIQDYLRRLSEEKLGTQGLEESGLDSELHVFLPKDDAADSDVATDAATDEVADAADAADASETGETATEGGSDEMKSADNLEQHKTDQEANNE